MKILKVVRHLGVDKMLKTALGDKLTLYRPIVNGSFTDPTSYIKDLPFPYTTKLDNKNWDIIIQDDIDSVNHLNDITANEIIWYVHGTYHLWEGFQLFFNKRIKRCHVLFPDFSREGYIKSWYRGEFKSQLILPIHLSDEYFIENIPNRNGQVFTMGNNLSTTCSLYGFENKVKKILEHMSKTPFSIFGYNTSKFDIDSKFYKGSVSPIREHVANYSASIHPSFVATCSFVLLECMAAGVPVITTPKASIPLTHNKDSYVISSSPEEMAYYVDLFLKDEDLSRNFGAKGRDFLRENFPWRNYVNLLNEWVRGIYEGNY